MIDPPDFDSLLFGFLNNPEGPEGLALQSAIQRAMQPRMNAAQALTEALALQQVQPGSTADTAVMVASCAYEAVVQPLDADLWANFRDQAARLVHERRCHPPPIESIIGRVAPVPDAAYDFAGDLSGMRGTWHRLWGQYVMEAMGLLHFKPGEGLEIVQQLEALLERPLAVGEIEALRHHAQEHAAYLDTEQARGMARRATRLSSIDE